MAANLRLGQTRLAARCGASGRSRNAPETQIGPTEGRVLPPPNFNMGFVALLGRYTMSPYEARLTTGRNNPGQMILTILKLLQQAAEKGINLAALLGF